MHAEVPGGRQKGRLLVPDVRGRQIEALPDAAFEEIHFLGTNPAPEWHAIGHQRRKQSRRQLALDVPQHHLPDPRDLPEGLLSSGAPRQVWEVYENDRQRWILRRASEGAEEHQAEDRAHRQRGAAVEPGPARGHGSQDPRAL